MRLIHSGCGCFQFYGLLVMRQMKVQPSIYGTPPEKKPSVMQWRPLLVTNQTHRGGTEQQYCLELQLVLFPVIQLLKIYSFRRGLSHYECWKSSRLIMKRKIPKNKKKKLRLHYIYFFPVQIKSASSSLKIKVKHLQTVL